MTATLRVLSNSAGLAQMPSNETWPLREEIKKQEEAVCVCTAQRQSAMCTSGKSLFSTERRQPCSLLVVRLDGWSIELEIILMTRCLKWCKMFLDQLGRTRTSQAAR